MIDPAKLSVVELGDPNKTLPGTFTKVDKPCGTLYRFSGGPLTVAGSFIIQYDTTPVEPSVPVPDAGPSCAVDSAIDVTSPPDVTTADHAVPDHATVHETPPLPRGCSCAVDQEVPPVGPWWLLFAAFYFLITRGHDAMTLRGATVVVLAAAIGGCPEADDLPLGWEGASGAAITQGPCEGSAYDAYTPTVAATGGVGEIVVEYDKAHFRCEQAVEAFVLPDAAGYRVLVQPVDMTPEHIVRCDCLYKVSVRFGAPPGSYQITVFRRWDLAAGGDGRMVKIGSASALVR